MFLRVRLRVQKSCFIYYIILHVVAFKAVKECADYKFKLLGVLLRGEHGGRDLLIQQHAARDLMGGKFGHALEHCSRTVLVHGMCRRASFSEGLLGVASVRRRHCAKTLTYVRGDRGSSAVTDAADRASAEAGVLIFLHLIQVGCISINYQLICVIVVVAIFRRVIDQHLSDPLALFAGKVCRQSVHELIAGDLPLFINQFLDRGEAVSHVRDTDLQAGDEIVNGAALFDGLAASQAVLRQAGAEDVGHFALTRQVDRILDDDTCAGQLSDRAVPCLHELVKRFHIPEVAVILYKSLAAGHVDSVVHDHQENTGEVQVAHTGAAIAPFAGNCGLHTSDCGIAIGVLFPDTLLNKGRNDHFIVVESRHSGPKL